jgi:DNA-binding IclR family transcriptional regulator
LRYAPNPKNKRTTPYTNLDSAKFIARLREALRTGIAWNMRESDKDIVSLATIVREPFIPTPRLSVALVMRQDVLIHRDQPELESSLLQLAADLERQLGQR